MNYTLLLEEVKNNVTEIYATNECGGLPYHNLQHTEEVVAHAGKIASHYKLDDTDFFTVVAAAWFHDSGYCKGRIEDHEINGANMAENFLKPKGVDASVLQTLRKCIMATVLPQKPVTLLEQIICDADLYHFGTDNFAERNKLMRKEAEWRSDKKIDKDKWRRSTIALLESHHFQTGYAIELLQDGKDKNLEKLHRKNEENETEKQQKKQDEIEKPLPVPAEELALVQNAMQPTTEELSKKKQKAERPERGIETMFRITSGNHQRLSDMADNKAHIMITTTSIIISVLLSVLFRKLEENPYLTIPAVMLLTVCVVTMVFSILATRPSLPSGLFTPDDIKDKKVNLLFFGNFYKMSYEEYSAGMQQVMVDREFLYGSLTKDIYSQGIVLGRKYRLLRIGYNMFMFGIVASVIAFVIASIFFSH